MFSGLASASAGAAGGGGGSGGRSDGRGGGAGGGTGAALPSARFRAAKPCARHGGEEYKRKGTGVMAQRVEEQRLQRPTLL